jgi:hypothetical protein
MPHDARMSLPPDRPNLDVLLDRALQTGGETDGFDFKELLDFRSNAEHKIKLLKAIGAFGNTDNGGHVIIGVSNDRRVVGLTPELAATYDQTPVHRMVGEYFAPPPAIQVRQHERDGKKLVIIEVAPFRDFPSIVKKYEVQGREKLQDGTFLVRNAAAESALLTTEAEVRKLCDAIATRRARSIVELIQRGTVGLPVATPQSPSQPHFESLAAVRRRAETFWSSAEGAPPYLETHFAPEHSLGLPGARLTAVFPASAIPVQNGFPFHRVSTGQVEAPQAWGWLGVIPFYEEPNAEHHPSYLWLLERSGAFLYRTHFWEDESQHYKGTVGIFHVIGKLVLTLRFLDRLTRRLELPEPTIFRVGVAVNHVKGRYITNEKMGYRDEYASTAETRVEAFLDAPLGAIRGAREDFAVNLLEEVVWQFRRQDWSRQDLVGMLRSASRYMGPEYAFPDRES